MDAGLREVSVKHISLPIVYIAIDPCIREVIPIKEIVDLRTQLDRWLFVVLSINYVTHKQVAYPIAIQPALCA